MAITENRRMQQLRGKYADLDKTKMLVGEIAVSTDHAPIVKADTNKYYELLTAEDADYLQNLTDEVKTTLADVTQLAIDKVGINDEVESKVQTFSSEKIMNLHENQFKVLSGTEVVASDSSSGYATDFSCEGKVEQKQYSGKNLLNNTATTQTLYGLNITVNADKSITVVGTPTQECNITIAATKTLSAGTYILSGNPISDGVTRISAVTTTGAAYPDNGGGRTFTLTEDANVYVIIVFKNGATYNHTFYPMIRLATVTDATYEPYTGGASPNPNYPQTIFNSGDCVELQNGAYGFTNGVYVLDHEYISNKHRIPCKSGDVVKIKTEREFNKGGLVYYNGNTYVSSSTITDNTTFTELEVTVPSGVTHFNFDLRQASAIDLATVGKIELTINGKYVLQVKSVNKNLLDTSKNVNGVLTADGSVYAQSGTYTSDYIEVNGDVTLSLQSYTAETWLRICLYDTDKNFISRSLVQATDTVKSLTVNHNGLIRVSYEINAVDVQVELNSTATDYVPHAENTITLLLNEPLRAVNDVKDIIEYVNDGYKVRRKIVNVTFNGSETWITGGTSTGEFRTAILRSDIKKVSNNYVVANILCDCYIAKNATDTWNGIEGISVDINGNILIFDKNITSLTEWKSWLASNPITVQYELAEEVIEDIADQTPFYQIQTFDGGTTISTTDRLHPQIEVEYPTNRVSGVASAGYTKASALSDKILSYQFRDLQGDVLGAVYTVNLPEGVDGRNCTVITSYCITPTKYSEMDAGYPWYYGSNFNTYTSDKGVISTIIGYITEATSGYAHVNVTVIRNDI